MNETIQWISVCVTLVLLLVVAVAGPTECTVRSQQEATKRVAETCAGDLESDTARAIACALAVSDARRAGSNN